MEASREFVTQNAAETEAVGRQVAEGITAGKCPRFIALYGDLGVGKTVFVRGLCSVLCPDARVKSPTFTVVNEYRGAIPVFHFDAYRIDSEDDLASIGFDDYLCRDGVVALEWSEKVPFALPESYLAVTVEKTENPDERRITVRAVPDTANGREGREI